MLVPSTPSVKRFAASLLMLVCIAAGAAVAEARPVTAIWDANTDGFTVGYRIYYGPSSGTYAMDIDVGNVTSYRLDLIPGIPHYFVVRAYNASGALGPPSNEVPVTLPNQAPALFLPGELVVPGGPISALIPAMDPDGDPLTFFAAGLPPGISINSATGAISGSAMSSGTYTVTVRVSDGHLSAQATAQVTVVGGAGCAGAPAAATMRAAVINGNQVSLSWTPATSGAPPTSYVLETGSAPGQSNIVVVELPLTTTVSATAPNGLYYARVKARNVCGETTSNEISFRVGPPAPSAPTLSFQRSGSTVTLSWTAPSSGTPTSYLIEVGSATGLTNLLSYNTGSAARTLSAAAPAGRYYVRVRAVNPSGAGSASNEVVISVP